MSDQIRLEDPPESRLEQVLDDTFGFSTFRPLQREIITGLLAGENSFVLMPTGGGKSLCYQLPALLLDGLTIVVSPLIALMKDQVDSLVESGVEATFINSSLESDEIDRRRRGVIDGTTKLLYVAPERLLTPSFLSLLDSVELSLLAIDEAHCISEWGHDFRSEYRRLATIRERYPDVPVVAMTATANERVSSDILAQLQLGDEARIYIAGFDRPNLQYMVAPRAKRALPQITDMIDAHPEASGIVYCRSRAETERIAGMLTKAGYSSLPYHAGLEREQRARHQEAFERDEIDIICATVAFGMGIDKPDVRFVIHHGIPKNLMAYYQETGRAGRDGLPSDCLLLYARSDRGRIFHFINEMTDPQERRIAMTALDEMVGYAESGECRRRVLLRYFGEEYPEESCGNCDNCLNPDGVEEVDATEMAQKLLSTVVRLRENFGMGYTIDVLRGSQNRKILSNRHTEVSTYGIGSGHPKAEWQWLGGALIAEGYLLQRAEAFNTLAVTERGWSVLRAEESVTLRRHIETSRAAAKPASRKGALDTLPATNQRLFELLRKLRKQIADDRGVPPFVVFGDRTLHGIAASLPSNEEELLDIHGIGQEKARRHGPAFLEEVSRFIEATPEIGPVSIDREAMAASTTRSTAEGPSETLMMTDELRRQGLSLIEIAEQRNVRAQTIENHFADLVTHGLIESIEPYVPSEQEEAIREAFKAVGTERLSPVVNRLGGTDNVPWVAVKMVRALIDREEA